MELIIVYNKGTAKLFYWKVRFDKLLLLLKQQADFVFLGFVKRSGQLSENGLLQGASHIENVGNGKLVDIANAKGPLWVATQIIVKNYISDNVTVFFMIIATFQGIVVAKTLRTYSESFTFSAYLFKISSEASSEPSSTQKSSTSPIV